MNTSFKAAIFALLLAPSLATFAPAQEALSGAQVQAALKDKRVALTCLDGTNGSGRYTMAKNSGFIKGSYTRVGKPSAKDVGEVRAQGDQLCLRFKILNGGEESCFGVRANGAGRFQFVKAGVTACNVSAL